MLRTFVAALAMILLPGVAAAQSRCGQVLAQLSGLLVDATCFESTDLTTTNPCNDSCEQFDSEPACIRVHAADRPRHDRSERSQAAADHQGRSGPADPGALCK